MHPLSGYGSNQLRFTDSRQKVHNQGMNIVRVHLKQLILLVEKLICKITILLCL